MQVSSHWRTLRDVPSSRIRRMDLTDKDAEIERLTGLLAELNAKYLYMSDLVFKFRNINSELIGRQIVLERELKVYMQAESNRSKLKSIGYNKGLGQE